MSKTTIFIIVACIVIVLIGVLYLALKPKKPALVDDSSIQLRQSKVSGGDVLKVIAML